MNISDFLSRFFNALLYEHPIHSMTVHFPIALAGAGFLFIILALWRRNETLERAAFYNMTLVTISTVVAGSTGMWDNLSNYDGEAPLASAKIFVAITLFILSLGTTVTRWRQPEVLWKPSTMILYVAAFAVTFLLTSALGFMGGVILYGF